MAGVSTGVNARSAPATTADPAEVAGGIGTIASVAPVTIADPAKVTGGAAATAGTHSSTSSSGGSGMQEASTIAFGGFLGVGALGIGLTCIGLRNCSGRSLDIAVVYTPAFSHNAHTSRRL